ncbi:MAG: PAS domain-containing sensor histidine kinase [Rhodobacteraceae bacterium]|nr:PAS domain-containing sensor histidine kinase [Paracoccaceae bacterium]MBL4811812.1 PAS domain-containing sensor histidine kinase [Paracoccaceae bacterium]
MQRSLTGKSLLRIGRWRRQRRIQSVATFGLVLLGPVLVALTYFVLGPLDQGENGALLRVVLLSDFVYILVVAALILQRVAQMIAARRAGSAGSRLHLRLTFVFALLALIPAVIVAIFSMLTINIGLEGWFSERVRNVLGSSLSAAVAYGDEHKAELSRDAEGLASFLNAERQRRFFMTNGDLRQALGQVQPQIERGLTEAFIIDGAGTIRARGARSYEFDYEQPNVDDFELALRDGIAIIEDFNLNEFRALIPLRSFEDHFLYVTRTVDGAILSLLDETQETVALYEQLEKDRGRVLFEFGLLYLGFATILILAAVWLGLWFAERLSRPVGRLVAASQRVGEGDLDVRVVEDEGDDEISQLGTYFNKMTTQLKAQREALVENTNQIERRRRLFDSVLSSVTSGVVGLDPEGKIAFANRSAQRLLFTGDENATSAPEDMALSVAVPEFSEMFDELRKEQRASAQQQINIMRGGKQESLLVRMAPRRNEEETLEGYVVAFDDVTDLVSAQRTAAWGDVARRIAHEIKNPLTPIQLSAERIKRKFGKELSADDAEMLSQMTDVIIRQTEGLRRIVDEFSRFARMPEPERAANDLSQLVKDAVLLQRAGQPNVEIIELFEAGEFTADIDENMIGQALTNLIKNAGEAIESYVETGAPSDFKPMIKVALSLENSDAVITISDNGIGLPADRGRLFEPYVTTRDAGTGLGLPIVKKIIEEHGGTLQLVDAEIFSENKHHGAMAVIRLPVLPPVLAVANG